MAYRKVDDISLISVADAIRSKGGTSDELVFPDGFVTAISAIQAGGGVSEPSTISGINLHNKETDIPNTYLSGAAVIAYNGWTTTDFIPVEEGKFYLVYSTRVIKPQYCSTFDANKGNAKALGVTINCTDKNKPIFLIGHNGYFRFSSETQNINALEVYEVINFNWKV